MYGGMCISDFSIIRLEKWKSTAMACQRPFASYVGHIFPQLRQKTVSFLERCGSGSSRTVSDWLSIFDNIYQFERPGNVDPTCDNTKELRTFQECKSRESEVAEACAKTR